MKYFRGYLSLAIVLAAGSAWGLGFRNPDQGARATGQGEAFVAQADDASAIYYNPAGLTQVKGTQFTSGMYVNFPNITFHPAGGGELKAQDDMFMLPHVYVASDFGLPKWRFGLGFNIPYGNSITWGSGNQLSALVDKSTMAIYNIAPTIAYQITDQLSIGAGLNIYYGDLMSRFDYLPTTHPFYPLFPSAKFEFRGDDITAGGTIGLLWTPHWQHSFGAVWRSPFTMNFEGTAVVNNPNPLPNPGPSPAIFKMEFPQSLAVGYAFRPTKKLKLEFDIEWTNWDTLNTCTMSSLNPYVAGDPRAAVPFNWSDSLFYEFGIEYTINEHWQVRGGYIFSENTVPTASFSPNLPDNDRDVLSAGVTFNIPRYTVNLTYQYSHTHDRAIVGGSAASPAVNGTWSSSTHAVMLTSTMRF